MTLHPRDRFEAPADTARVARAASPKGNVYMTMHDELDIWYKDSDFAELFIAKRGRPAESPGRLALITVMQFAEGLSDRQAADAVRARIDWKYALGLTLEDAGFDLVGLKQFNRLGVLGWYTNGKMGRQHLSPRQIQMYNLLLPVGKLIDGIGLGPGLSLIGIGRKPLSAYNPRSSHSRLKSEIYSVNRTGFIT